MSFKTCIFKWNTYELFPPTRLVLYLFSKDKIRNGPELYSGFLEFYQRFKLLCKIFPGNSKIEVGICPKLTQVKLVNFYFFLFEKKYLKFVFTQNQNSL